MQADLSPAGMRVRNLHSEMQGDPLRSAGGLRGGSPEIFDQHDKRSHPGIDATPAPVLTPLQGFEVIREYNKHHRARSKLGETGHAGGQSRGVQPSTVADAVREQLAGKESTVAHLRQLR